MSVIFGLFYRDGRLVSDELDVMFSGMKHFPHNKRDMIIHDNCGFGNMLNYNTPEAVNESMPKWLPLAQLLFVAEGRIDNRDELFITLGIPAEKQKTMPDGDLMLEAYMKWGESSVDRLIGKWSFAAFHAENQKLFIARDKCDYTEICYYIDDKVIIFATSSKGILSLPFIKKEIDDLKIARFLIVWKGDYDRTFFRHIKRILPSHTLRITQDTIELHRYWNYTKIQLREGLSQQEYIDDLFDNLSKAVAARLRSYKPIAATLSGGLDSSTVCAIAAEQMNLKGKHLRTYSHIPEFTPSSTLSKFNFGNEKPYIETIVNKCKNIDPIFLDSSTISPLTGIEEAFRLNGEPFHAAGNAYWIVDIFMTAVKEGYGTILMGEFGNATISWTGMEDALSFKKIVNRYGVIRALKKKLLKPILYGNTSLARTYKSLIFGSQPWKKISYCTKSFQESLNLEEQIKRSGFDPTFKRYFSNPKDQAFSILDGGVLRYSIGANIGCMTGLELRDPTTDSRVIESALSIPNEMYLGKMNKWILRTMMREKLPEEVLFNTRKGKQSSDLTARLCAHAKEMNRIIDEMEAVGFGRIADIDRIRLDWEKIQVNSDDFHIDTVFHLLRPIAAFIMYKSIDE